MTNQPADLEQLAKEFTAARAELAELRKRMLPVQAKLADLKPQVTAAIVDDIKAGRRTQTEISKLTGYTPERIRQLCRANGVTDRPTLDEGGEGSGESERERRA